MDNLSIDQVVCQQYPVRITQRQNFGVADGDFRYPLPGCSATASFTEFLPIKLKVERLSSTTLYAIKGSCIRDTNA
jgi:hypothetical protein